MQQSNRPRWIMILTVVVAIGFITTIIIRVSNVLGESSYQNKLDETTKVTIITSDEVVDQSWGSLAYIGQLKIEEQFPIDVTLYSKVNTKKLQLETLEKTIEEGADVIIGHGREFSEVFTKLAPNHRMSKMFVGEEKTSSSK